MQNIAEVLVDSEVPQPVHMFYAWPNIFDCPAEYLSVPPPPRVAPTDRHTILYVKSHELDTHIVGGLAGGRVIVLAPGRLRAVVRVRACVAFSDTAFDWPE